MKYDKKKALNIIVSDAKKYQIKLRDKNFLIIYQSSEKCLNGKLTIEEIDLDQNGKAQQKLSVLPFLHELLYHNCMIGTFINSGICIIADYFVGDTKAVLSVGFRTGKRADFPVTLYKEDVCKLSNQTNKVFAIFVKDYGQQKYEKCVYLSKGQEIDKLHVSDEVKDLISVENEPIV